MPQWQQSVNLPMQAQGDDSDHFPGAGFGAAIPFDPALHGPFLANGVCEPDQVQEEDEEIHADICGGGDALGGVEQYAQCNDAPDGREDALQMTHLAALSTSRQGDGRKRTGTKKLQPKYTFGHGQVCWYLMVMTPTLAIVSAAKTTVRRRRMMYSRHAGWLL